MKVYCGDTRSRRLLACFRARGIGQVVIRGRLGLKRLSPWFLDNGAFEDWRAERDFDALQFRADLKQIDQTDAPDFIVAPDRVAAGAASLALSVSWLPELRAQGSPVYLAVQDGMDPLREVDACLFDGIFIGGTLPWKIATAPGWAELGKRLGLPVHFARCGTAGRVSFARAIGCASLDSSLPLWSRQKMRVFLDALDQCHLWGAP